MRWLLLHRLAPSHLLSCVAAAFLGQLRPLWILAIAQLRRLHLLHHHAWLRAWQLVTADHLPEQRWRCLHHLRRLDARAKLLLQAAVVGLLERKPRLDAYGYRLGEYGCSLGE